VRYNSFMGSYLPHKLFVIIISFLVIARLVLNPQTPPRPITIQLLSPTPIATITPTITPLITRPPKPTVTPIPVSLQWGAYSGWSGDQAAEFEKKIGKKMNLVATFVHWGNEKEFPQDLANYARKNGQTLVIYWEAMDYNHPDVDNNPDYSYDRILSGFWDDYFKTFAQSVKNYGGPVILIPFEEANGDWYPWSATKNGNTVDKYLRAFRYIYGFFQNVTNVKIAWDINQESAPNTPENSLSAYYPGNEYVDYVGTNGFNFDSPWQSFDQIFNRALTYLNTLSKPVYIFSMACAQGPKKSAWIQDALQVQMPKYSRLKGFVWFNENKEKDWRIWSDANSLKTFSSGVHSN